MTIKEKYTRVSTILGVWSDFSHVDPGVLANKCRIGTNVHQKIEGETEGFLVDLEADEQGYFDSWVEWKKKKKLEGEDFVQSEERYYCDEHMITGCVDALIRTEKGLQIVDYKTSASPNMRVWSVQAAFYHYLAWKGGVDLHEEVLFIHLKKDGKAAKERPVVITRELVAVREAALLTYAHFKG